MGGAATDNSTGLLVAQARAGDRAAQRQLFEQWQRPIYGYLRQMVRDDELAADLTQETFVKALRNLPRLSDPEAFRSWLFRIAVNLVRDRRSTVVEPLEAAGEPVDPQGEPSRQVLRDELRAAVDQAVAQLSAEHREVVVLHHLQGLDLPAISRLLRLPAGTVKSRLARARDVLRRKLAPYVEE
ncbi:MAG: sigma-70 family RNA polymerase sigma factor [Fimbriimonadaceae bacterium]|nr:sigma-70 family RNA polymerase sigma factor [Fimbriimonadaceae bacterium]